MKPEVRYAKSGDVNIAYQASGDGPLDLVLVHGWVTHLDLMWEEPALTRFHQRLEDFSRLILFDKRGTGLSDRVPPDDLPTLEQRMDDLRAVMDAVSSERAAVMSISEGAPMAALFAASYPERTEALVIYGGYSARQPSDDYPWAPTPDERQEFYDLIERDWGGVADLQVLAPSMVGDRRFEEWWSKYLRAGASPSAALALARMNTQIDIRNILSSIHVPTLIMHRTHDRDSDVRGARYMAERIPGARFVELAGTDHLPWVDPDPILVEAEEFLTGRRTSPEPERVLTTVLFTDIVGSTKIAAEVGDRTWADLLERHHSLVRRELATYRGQEVDTAGDGFLATFDGPARAVQCGCAVRDVVREIGLEIRAGVHTGEVERRGDELAGLGVHIGARVATIAQPGEVLVSRTVTDLVAGSGLRFESRGLHQLRGVPGDWELYAVLC
jgi:class 3 adenylate cyclase